MLNKEQYRQEIIAICRGARIAEGLTQKQMAQKIASAGGYVSEASISQFESGGNNSMYMIYCYLKTCKELNSAWQYIPIWLDQTEEKKYGKNDKG